MPSPHMSWESVDPVKWPHDRSVFAGIGPPSSQHTMFVPARTIHLMVLPSWSWLQSGIKSHEKQEYTHQEFTRSFSYFVLAQHMKIMWEIPMNVYMVLCEYHPGGDVFTIISGIGIDSLSARKSIHQIWTWRWTGLALSTGGSLIIYLSRHLHVATLKFARWSQMILWLYVYLGWYIYIYVMW